MNISSSKFRHLLLPYSFQFHFNWLKRLQLRPYILLNSVKNEVLLFDISHKEDLEMSETEL